MKRENNYLTSTTSKVVQENENESIPPDFRTILSTAGLIHDINSEWTVCFSELDPSSKERRNPPLFGFYVARRGAGWHGGTICFCSLTAPLLEPSENIRAYTRTVFIVSPLLSVKIQLNSYHCHTAFSIKVNFHCSFLTCFIV